MPSTLEKLPTSASIPHCTTLLPVTDAILPNPVKHVENKEKGQFCFGFACIANVNQRQELQRALCELIQSSYKTVITGNSTPHPTPITLSQLNREIATHGKVSKELRPAFIYILEKATRHGIMHAHEVLHYVCQKSPSRTITQSEKQQAVLTNIQLEKEKHALEHRYLIAYIRLLDTIVEVLTRINPQSEEISLITHIKQSIKQSSISSQEITFINTLCKKYKASPSITQARFEAQSILDDINEISLTIQLLYNDDISLERHTLLYHHDITAAACDTLLKYALCAEKPTNKQLKAVLYFFSQKILSFSLKHPQSSQSSNLFSLFAKEIKAIEDQCNETDNSPSETMIQTLIQVISTFKKQFALEREVIRAEILA